MTKYLKEVSIGRGYESNNLLRNKLKLSIFVPPISKGTSNQCDQMARFWFNIWPFATPNICPKPFKICQSKLNYCRRVNEHFQNGPSLITKWGNFAKSGHTAEAKQRPFPPFCFTTLHSKKGLTRKLDIFYTYSSHRCDKKAFRDRCN